ncbi:MAG: fatty acid desaturase family protein [Pseudomonadota bacterium]
MQQTDTLDRAALAQIRDAHRGPRPWALLKAMLFDYAVLACVIAAMVSLAWGPWFWALLPIAWVIIAARQHALLVLMHEATHSLAHPLRWVNEFWGEVLLGAPMLVSMRKYRQDHLAHHRHANSDLDPDWVRKLGSAEEAAYWQFPVAGNGFSFLLRSWVRSIGYLIRSFTHLTGVTRHQGEPGTVQTRSRLEQRIGQARGLFYGAMVLTLSLVGGWGFFIALWLAPILLVLPIIMRLRSIAEHFALPCDTVLNSTRSILCGPVERFLFAPHHINYHLEHHLIASVSFAELPALHAALMQQPAYAAGAALNDSYLWGPGSLRADMTTQPRKSPAVVSPATAAWHGRAPV